MQQGEATSKLIQAIQNTRNVEGLSNKELTDELIEKVWNRFDIQQKESALIEEAIERLKEL